MTKHAGIKKFLANSLQQISNLRRGPSDSFLNFPWFIFVKLSQCYIAFLLILICLESFSGLQNQPSISQQLPTEVKKVLQIAVVLRLDDQENQSVHSINYGIEIAKILFSRQNPGIEIKIDRLAYDESPENLRAVAERVIASGTPSVIGGEWSREALDLGDLLKERNAVFVTPTASNPTVTENRPYVFRICLPDDVVASRMAFYTLDRLKPKALAIVHDASSPYSDYLSQKYFETVMEQLNRLPDNYRPLVIHEKFETATPPETRSINKEEVDFRPMIERFKRQNVTHVTLLSYSSDLIPFLKQANEADFHPVYIGGDGWGADSRFYDIVKSEHIDLTKFHAYRNFYWDNRKDTELVRQFRSEFVNLYKVPPDGLDAVGFDAAWVLFTAMSKAENPQDADKIRREMLQFETMNLLTSDRFQFEQNSGLSSMHIYELTGNGGAFVETID